MRACFLGQSVAILGFGVAMLQAPPLPEAEALTEEALGETDAAHENISPAPADTPAARKAPPRRRNHPRMPGHSGI